MGRPSEHVRRLPSGKRILINKGVRNAPPMRTGSPPPMSSLTGLQGWGEARRQRARTAAHKTLRERLTDRFIGRTRVGNGGTTSVTYSHINPTTREGWVRVKTVGMGTGANMGKDRVDETVVRPHVTIAERELLQHTDYRGANLTGSSLRSFSIHDVNFTGIMGDGMTVSGFHTESGIGTWYGQPPPAEMKDVSFAYASLYGAAIHANLRGVVTFEGADLSNVDFNVTVHGVVDVTESNATREQILSLIDATVGGGNVRYDTFTADEVCAATGMDDDDFTTAVWAGDIEVRDRDSGQLVVGRFDADRHVIPMWELRRLCGATEA